MRSITLYLLLITLTLAACRMPPGDSALTSPTLPTDPLISTQWTLVALGAPETAPPALADAPVILEFSADGRAIGFAGCNTYSSTYTVQADTLTFATVTSTKLACPEASVMQQEQQYLQALPATNRFALAGEQLTLLDSAEQPLLTFTAGIATAASSTPTSAVASAPSPLTPTLTITTPRTSDVQAEPTPLSPPVLSSMSPSSLSPALVWLCYYCGGKQVWRIADGQAQQVELPVEIGVFFDYAPATQRILYGTHFPEQGAGPGTVSVIDLWMFDLATGQATPIFSTEDVVEAVWAPDGQGLAYVRATAESYELRWHTLNGEDRLLATEVAFTFSVAPGGERVAFTRESSYAVDSQPGLYVVEVATGAEQLIATVDRAGTGALEDRPIWSPDGAYVLLSLFGVAENPGLLRAAVDGSNTVMLMFDPALAAADWYGVIPSSLLWTTDTQLIGTTLLSTSNAPLGGEPHVMLYQLNEALDTIIKGVMVAAGIFVSWDVPNVSVWVQVGTELQRVPLPVQE